MEVKTLKTEMKNSGMEVKTLKTEMKNSEIMKYSQKHPYTSGNNNEATIQFG